MVYMSTAGWPSGKARVCKTLTTGSNPVPASSLQTFCLILSFCPHNRLTETISYPNSRFACTRSNIHRKKNPERYQFRYGSPTTWHWPGRSHEAACGLSLSCNMRARVPVVPDIPENEASGPRDVGCNSACRVYFRASQKPCATHSADQTVVFVFPISPLTP